MELVAKEADMKVNDHLIGNPSTLIIEMIFNLKPKMQNGYSTILWSSMDVTLKSARIDCLQCDNATQFHSGVSLGYLTI